MQRLINKLRPSVKDLIGIEKCHFAIDPKTKKLTENNTSMLVKAIRQSLARAEMPASEIEALFLATALPDCHTPPLTTLVQQELGLENCAEIEVHSNCTGITKVFQIALDALRQGRYQTVVIGYSQLSSAYLRSEFYNQSKIGRENTLLRWFLSDSACALVLRARDVVAKGIKVIEVYNESLGGKLEPAMWMNFGATNFLLPEAFSAGLHHLGQNYNAVVNELGEPIFVKGFKRMMEKCEFDPKKIDYLIATIPSKLLLDKAKKAYLKNFSIPADKWFSNIADYGYSGSSTIIIALDELLSRGLLKKNDFVTSITIESSKWMFGGFILEKLG